MRVYCTSPECRKPFDVSDYLAGTSVICPACGQRTQAPQDDPRKAFPSNRPVDPPERPTTPTTSLAVCTWCGGPVQRWFSCRCGATLCCERCMVGHEGKCPAGAKSAGQVTPPLRESAGSSPIPMIALAFGAAAAAFLLMPFLWMLSFPLGVLGCVFGVIGLAGRKPIPAVLGLFLALPSVALSGYQILVVQAAFGDLAKALEQMAK